MLGQPSLPPNACDFNGREREIKEIASHLKSPSTRVVSIYGPPGSGKSEVAIAVGQNLKSEGKAIYHIDLTDVNTEDDLISAILRFFCDQSLGPLQPLDFLLKQFSLIKDSVSPYFTLDNADGLLQTRKSKKRFLNIIKQIITSCSSVKILVATRESTESTRKLKPLGQKLVRIGSVDTVFSRKLVQKCFPEGYDGDWRKVALFCGHMPFAIRLFCNNMPRNELPLSQAIDNFISLIESDLSELDDQDELEEEKMNAILESSYQILSPENKEFYVSLSVIPDMFNEKVAAAVWGISTHAAQRTLQSLQKRSLIDSCVGSKPYKVPNIFRLFARQKGAREMNEVILRSTTRFTQFYISLFAELNDRFLSGQSMPAFIDFYEDKQNIISSLINGCLNISTRDNCFDALTQGILFLDTVLWSDRASFDKIYDTSITEAKQRTDSSVYNELVLAKTFSEVTWGTEEVETKQLHCNTKEVLSCDTDEQKGKLLCYLGIHKLANGQIMHGVIDLENYLAHFRNIADPMQKILRILTLQILGQYYESIRRVDKATTFFENAKEECVTREQEDLLLIPNIPGKNVKIKEDERRMANEENRPLELEMYFLLTKATKIFSSVKTMELFEREVNKWKKKMEEKCNSVENLKVGSLYIHRFVVGVLAEMTKYEEAIESIQSAVLHQENVISMAEETQENHKEALARSYSYLAVLQFRVQDYSSSLRSQRRAMDIKREIFGEQHPDVADSYHDFAIISRTIGDCDSALQFQERVLEMRLNFSELIPLKVAASYHELGVTQCKMKDYSSALRSHESALTIRLENLGKNHRDTANSYHELGVTQWFLEKYQCALDSHQETLGILRDVMGEQHRATADSYHEIGKTYFCLEDYRAALRLHLLAFRLRLEVLGERHTETANSCCEIGVTQFEMGWYASALQYHTRALNMRQTMHGNSPHSEVAQSFYQLGRVQCQMENFDEAVNSLNRALSIRKGLKQEHDIETADIYHELGKAFIHQEDYKSAFEMHQFALGIRKSKMGEAHATVADSLFQLGLVEWKQGENEESLHLHRRAADIREKYFGKKNHRTAESYFQLGLMLSQSNCYNEALELHKQALAIWEELLGYMHSSLADSYLETGCALIDVGKFDSAFISLENALNIRTRVVTKQAVEVADLPHEKKVKELLLQDYHSSLQLYKRVSTIIHDHSSSFRSQKNSLKELLGRFEGQLIKKANCYFDVGEEEFRRDKLDAALHAHQRALNLRVTLLGENHIDTGSSFLSKGKVHFEMMDYTQALKSHQRALDIRREKLGDDHSHTADSYAYIGVTQDKLGHYSLALQSHKQALKIRRETVGENHLDTAISYENIGHTHVKLGNYDLALQSHQQALKIRREQLRDNHPHTANSYASIGNTQRALGDYNVALQSHKRALKIRRGIHGRKHLETAASYNDIGLIQGALGDYTLAIQSHQQALEIRLEQLGDNHLDTASSYNNIGIIQLALGDYNLAIESHQQALKIRLEQLGDNHPDTASSYNNIGVTQRKMGDYTSASRSFQQALEIRREQLGDNHLDTASSYNNIGIIQLALGDYNLAIESHQQALKIRLEQLGDNHPDTASSYNNIGVTQRKMGDYTSASRSFQQALEIRRERLGDNHPDTAMSIRNLESLEGVVQGRPTVFNSHQPVLRKRHTRLMDDDPDKAISHNDSGITEELLRRQTSLLLSLQGAQARREISEKKHLESFTTFDKIRFIKCALVILLILMIYHFAFPAVIRDTKRYI